MKTLRTAVKRGQVIALEQSEDTEHGMVTVVSVTMGDTVIFSERFTRADKAKMLWLELYNAPHTVQEVN